MLPVRPVLVVNTRSGVQSEHDLVGETVRHTAELFFLTAVTFAAELLVLRHVEQPRFDG